MPIDEDEIVYECVADYCECDKVPWWKLVLLTWFFLT